jgi:hypothetical protein
MRKHLKKEEMGISACYIKAMKIVVLNMASRQFIKNKTKPSLFWTLCSLGCWKSVEEMMGL